MHGDHGQAARISPSHPANVAFDAVVVQPHQKKIRQGIEPESEPGDVGHATFSSVASASKNCAEVEGNTSICVGQQFVVSPCRRYDVDFWGKAWQKTDNKDSHPAADDPNWKINLERCRCLIAKLDEEELRKRLLNSPFNQYKISSNVSWLREAADACARPLKYTKADGERAGKNKTHEELVEEVVQAAKGFRISSQRVEPMSTSQPVELVFDCADSKN